MEHPLQLKAKEIMEWIDRADKGDGTVDAESYRLKDGHPRWMLEYMLAIGRRMENDDIRTRYRFTWRALSAIEEADVEGNVDDPSNEEVAQFIRDEVIPEIEADIYTTDLTGWLHASVYHLQFVDSAISSFGCKGHDIASLLQMGQAEHIRDVAHAALDALLEIVGENEKE